ncbi:MAG: hypothetical protein ACJAZ9_001737 [Neolewinella sp.]|jgi:hypothetical protein
MISILVLWSFGPLGSARDWYFCSVVFWAPHIIGVIGGEYSDLASLYFGDPGDY